MDRSSLLFCGVSLAVTVLIAVLFFPMATLTWDELEASRQAAPAEEMESLELGDFGSVSVLELVDYYMENPPVETSGDAPARTVRFQGC
jgi:hypothetical protein